MEDLLRDDEFFPKKDDYNPWKGFILFYGFVILYFVVISALADFVRSHGVGAKATYVFGIFFLLMPFLMIFRKKKNVYLPVKTILLSVSVLATVMFLLMMINELVKDDFYFLLVDPIPISFYLQGFGVMQVYAIVCSGIILLIRWIKLKKLKQQSSSL
jgi:hypothetical protein